ARAPNADQPMHHPHAEGSSHARASVPTYVAIDRIAPTRRPDRHPAGYQRWRYLSFIHWRVPESAVPSLVAAELAIDTFDGDAYVGIVPFTMKGVRPRFAPAVPGLSSFHETNVRT